MLQQLQLADATTDPEVRRARLTFLVVGAGYTGTETAAQLQRMTQKQLSDGTVLPCRTVLWTAGVTPPPIVAHLSLPVHRGRLVVDEYLKLRDHVWAAAHSAAAIDPHNRDRMDYPPTAQHAQRQGAVIARNVAASLGVGTPTTYRHRDLGLVADLGGTKAVARPFGLPLTGLPAKVVTKGYHLIAIPLRANKLRVAADWLVNLVSRPTATQLGLVQESAALLGSE